MMRKLSLCLILLTLFASLIWTDNLQPGKREVVLEPTSKPVLSKSPLHLDLSKANLNKTPFERLEDSLYYCDLTNYAGIGITTGEFEGAIRLTPTELGSFTGWNIIAISWYHYDGGSPFGVVKVYDAGTSSQPGPEITSEPYSEAGVGWVRCNLSSPVLIGGSTDLWCSVEVTYPGGTYPLGIDSGPAIPGKSDWIYLSGSWQELRNLGFDYNWQIICIVDSLGPGVEETKTPVRESANSLNVSPNPFTTSTTIILPSTGQRAERIELQIYDASGRLVKSIELTTGTYQLGADLIPGVYFLKLKVGEHTEIQKLIKIK